MIDITRDGYYVIQPHTKTWNQVVFVPKTKNPTLKELQSAVGGFIEEVYLNSPHIEGDKVVAFVNEEGKIYNLAFNRLATSLFANPHDVINGPMVIVCGKAQDDL